MALGYLFAIGIPLAIAATSPECDCENPADAPRQRAADRRRPVGRRRRRAASAASSACCSSSRWPSSSSAGCAGRTRASGGPWRRSSGSGRPCSSSCRVSFVFDVPADEGNDLEAAHRPRRDRRVRRAAVRVPARAGAHAGVAGGGDRRRARGARHPRPPPRRPARRARRPDAAHRLLARRARRVRRRRRPPAGAAARRRPRPVRPPGRAGRALRRRDRPRPRARRGRPRSRAGGRPPAPRWRSRTRRSTRSCARGWRSFSARGRCSSTPGWPSGGGSSATCTTGRSSGSSRCRCSSGWSTRSSPAIPPRRRSCWRARAMEARAALEDLRELARGIHPAVLTDRGLPAALESLADRAPLPVEVSRGARASGCPRRWRRRRTSWSPSR